MGRLFTLMTGLLLAAALPAAGEEKHDSAWRLFVADHVAPEVRAMDAETGEVVAAFTLTAPARLYASESRRTIIAVQRDADLVNIIATGIELDDHGDHADLKIADPRLLETVIRGNKPVHLVTHGGRIAAFFDGEGVARLGPEAALHDGDASVAEVATAAPHHGVVIPMGSHVVVTIPDDNDPSNLPVGVRILDTNGARAGEDAACPGLHGEAASGNLVAIACETGILIVKQAAGGPQIRLLPYTAGLPEAKVSTLRGGRGLQYFLGNFGPSAVVLIDPEDADAFRLIELPVRRVDFAVDPVRAKFAYVFTEDGRLHQINVLSGTIARSLAVTEPYSMDGHWSDPRPRLAVAGDEIFVTDPLSGVIHAIDIGRFEKAREITAGLMPYNIVAVGGSGAAHD